jgi:hypothetical protein
MTQKLVTFKKNDLFKELKEENKRLMKIRKFQRVICQKIYEIV